MTDDRDKVVLHQSVIDDTEAQLSGDVETKWVELREQSAAPALPTDKVSALLYVLAADHRLRCKLSTGTVLDLTLAGAGPLTLKGAIAAAADFPPVEGAASGVENGWFYYVTADVTDDAGAPLHTNTGQHFLAGSAIAWVHATLSWLDVSEQVNAQYIAATPTAIGAGDVVAMVNVAGAVVVTLPAAGVGLLGKKITVVDVLGDKTLLAPIAITPNGTDLIDGVNVAVNVSTAYGAYDLICVQLTAGPATYGWTTVTGREVRGSTARLAAIGAGRSQEDSRQLAAASETLRVFRALAAGRIVACAAETGTVAAAGESMTFDVQIAGVTALTGVITIDDTVAIDTPVAGVVGAGAVAEFAAGELVSVVRTYVAGGGPTPMRDTVVDIEVQFD